MKLSELYGRKVFSKQGKKGYIIRIYSNNDKITGFECADENEREFYVPSQNVKILTEAIVFEETDTPNTADGEIKLGVRCYTSRGGYAGILRDIYCRGLKIKTAKIGTKSYPVNDIIMGEIVIIKPDFSALKQDVKKDGEILFKRGENPDKNMIARAISLGEYVQTNLKTL